MILRQSALERILLKDFSFLDSKVSELQSKTLALIVPRENSSYTLHMFNCELSDLFTEVNFYFYELKRDKEALEVLIESVLKDLYQGNNDKARTAAGYQHARNYPHPFEEGQSINLFDLADLINGYFYTLQASVKSLESKNSSKITSNSLMNIEKSLLPD